MLSLMAAVFFGACFVLAYLDTSAPQAKRIENCLEFTGTLLIPVAGIWLALWKLKQLGHLWY